MSETTPEAPVNEDEMGPKTREALAALDEAIDRVEAFQDDDDEQDAAPIWERVHRLQEKLAATSVGTSHLPKDALTGMPVDPAGTSVNLGPADPVVTPEESGQAASMPEGAPNLTDNVEAAPAQEQSSTDEITPKSSTES